MRRPLSIAFAIPAVILALAGCGRQDEVTTPVACLEPVSAWQEALDAAPGKVALDGVPISDCLPADQPAGEQETVGLTVVEVATILAREGLDDRTAFEAGYLVGALERGAGSTQGIHTTLIDRVTTAATNGLAVRPEAVRGAYREGYETGMTDG